MLKIKYCFSKYTLRQCLRIYIKTWWWHNTLLFWVFLCDNVLKCLPISPLFSCKCPIIWLYPSDIKINSPVQVTYWALPGKQSTLPDEVGDNCLSVWAVFKHRTAWLHTYKFHKYKIWNEFSFHTVIMNKLCLLYPRGLARGYTTHNKFHKYRMKWKFISDSFYHMIIPKNINISWKKYAFWENSARKSPWSVGFTRRHNVPSDDVTGKGAWSCRKRCYVTCVILENLWNDFIKR